MNTATIVQKLWNYYVLVMFSLLRAGRCARFELGQFCKPWVCIYSKIQTGLLHWQAMYLVAGLIVCL